MRTLKKKLAHFQILGVRTMQTRREGKKLIHDGSENIVLQAVDQAPEQGQFRVLPDGVELPERKPGEKFLVEYTTLHHKML